MRLTFQKASIIFAIFAWLMQLSVFITPILQTHPELGSGICKQLAIFNPPEAHVDHIKLEATQSQIQKSFLLAEQRNVEEKILYSADTFCKFCLVLGQNFNPVWFACLLLLLTLILGKIPHRLPVSSLKRYQKLYLTFFQNRGPPLSIYS